MAAPGTCLTAQQLRDLALGLVPLHEVPAAEAHVRDCPRCAGALERALAGAVEPEHTHVLGSEGGTPAAPRYSLQRGDSVGRYLVVEGLGVGGQGEVYAAFDTQLSRKVALKLLRPDVHAPGSAGATAGHARLLREAQAMAQLSHPNVLPVFDVGEHARRVFIAMELVEGAVTLRAWLEAAPRSWREVLRVLTAAGEGLAAAHKAGLVHRDFKPDNVLVGRDGRVVVMDFGLARTDGEEAGAPDVGLAPADDDASTSGARRLLGVHLTQAGVVAGTPGFMAPEQYRREPLDGGVDQFAFCVTLYQALYGQRPFPGTLVHELREATLAGRVRPPPRDSRVPGWVHRTLVRGLSVRRQDRFASMDALLAHLRADPSAQRRRWAAAAVLLVLVAAALASWRERAGAKLDACRAAGDALAATWSPARAQALERAFLAQPVPFARAAWERVSRAAGAYAAALGRQGTDACLATRVRGEASERVLALRTACLEERRGDLSAMLDVLATADAQVVQRAPAAAYALPALAPCADVDWLLRQVPPPAGEERRLAELRAQLAQAQALHTAGRYAEAAGAAGPLVEGARALGYAPLEAEALLRQGAAERALDQGAAAAEHLEGAVMQGIASGRGEVAALAAAELLALLQPHALERAVETRRWHALGRAALGADAPGRERALAALTGAWANVLTVQERYPEAERAQREALALARTAHGDDAWQLAGHSQDLGTVLRHLKRYDEALEVTRAALQLTLRHLGPEHPDMVAGHGLEAVTLMRLSRHQEAAEAFERARALAGRVLPPGHRTVVSIAHNHGLVLVRLRRYAEAERVFLETVALAEQAFGPESANVNLALRSLARTYLKTGQPAKARPSIARAMRIVQAKLPPDSIATLGTVLYAARVELEDGHPERAVPMLRGLLAHEGRTAQEPVLYGDARFALARALWATRGRAARAEVVPLLARARAQLASQGEAETLAELERWVQARELALPPGGPQPAAPPGPGGVH